MMVRVQTKVKLPFLWGKAVFRKSKWSQINLIVGPNGSGKTLLSEQLALQFEGAGYPVTFLRSDRANEESLLQILNTDLKVRQKIEDVLSNMFGKSIKFEERNGVIVPIVINKLRCVEYNLKEGECHGLKEIITLLIALYSCDSKCLILDEPELHLHPQFQLFFMNEIRKVVASDSHRIFFLITHSPFFIDLKQPEDLLGVVVCHVNHVPTYVENLSSEDEVLFRRFLPRFNTYHKQFFFSDNQIFVEGYTDQKLFSNLLNYVNNKLGSAGTGIIDVGGKDELGVFFKVCSLLGTNGRIIGDLDSLFRGKLRDVICEDNRPLEWLMKQEEKQKPFYNLLFTKKELQVPIDLERLVCKLELFLVNIGKAVAEIDNSISPEIDLLVEKVKILFNKYEKIEDLDTFKTVILQAVMKIGNELADVLPLPLARTIPLVKNLAYLIFAAAEAARVYILPKGCIEHYYTQNEIEYMPISGKDRLFHAELEYMNNESEDVIKKKYYQLIVILEKACSLVLS